MKNSIVLQFIKKPYSYVVYIKFRITTYLSAKIFELSDKSILFESTFFKSELIKHLRNKRLHFPEYGIGGHEGGLDFNFIEYSYSDKVPNLKLFNIAMESVKFLDERSINFTSINIDKHLSPLFNYHNHYLLLTALADAYSAKSVIEIGTASGSSLWALLNSSKVEKVITWDIVPLLDNSGWFANSVQKSYVLDYLQRNNSKWEQYIESLVEDEVWEKRKDIFENANLIFIDGPHDAEIFEKKLILNLLKVQNRNAILIIFDDILLSDMIRFWEWLPLPKLDISAIGHQSGTGIALLEPYEHRKIVRN